MRVLIVAPYLYNNEWPEFTANKTGLGIMLNDIVHSIEPYCDIKFTSNIITVKRGNSINSHTWKDVIKNIHIHDVFQGIYDFFYYQLPLMSKAKLVYYNLNKGYFRNLINEFQPDIVHVHSIGKSTKSFIDVCNELRVPYLVTLHGMILHDNDATVYDKEMEKNFIRESYDENIPVTVVSTGVKRKLEDAYLHNVAQNIYVVCNGTCIPYKKDEEIENAVEDKFDLRNQFHLLPEEKIAVVIGSVYERKNQIQIVRAMATGIIKTPCKIFMCGTVSPNSFVQQEIDKFDLNNKIYLLGFVPQHLIASVLEQADLNIVASRDEGFGLSIIEAYAHGVPTVTFSDLDAVPDLYNPDTMIKVVSREDIALANGIEEGLQRKWDRSVIKKFAQQFSLESMAKEYVKVYEKCVKTSDS